MQAACVMLPRSYSGHPDYPIAQEQVGTEYAT